MKNNCHNLKTITSLKKEQKELLIFLGIAFGLTFLMGLLWGVSRHYGKEGVSNVTQIVYPTLGVVLAKLIYEKDDPLLPKRTFIGLIVFAIPLIVLNILAFFLPEDTSSTLMETVSIFMMLGQGLYLILLFFEKSEKRAAYGMAWKNGRVSLRYILLFVVITIIANAVYLFLIGTPLEKICTESVLYFVKLPYAVFSYLATIGSIFWEEYGWRYYFQPVLQRKLGPVFGVLILGIMWELWHLPSILFNMNMSGMSLILLAVMRLFNTTSLAFCFGYIYLKTQNLWTAVIVHFLFDVICSIGGSLPADNTEISITWNEVSMVALSRLIIILPFVFLISREYKAQEKQQDEV